MDRKWLEMQIVRCGERWPERVGCNGRFQDSSGDRCILGQIASDAGVVPESIECAMMFFGRSDDVRELARQAATLNNQGVAWGEIPKQLGLVPGELPIEAPAELVEV